MLWTKTFRRWACAVGLHGPALPWLSRANYSMRPGERICLHCATKWFAYDAAPEGSGRRRLGWEEGPPDAARFRTPPQAGTTLRAKLERAANRVVETAAGQDVPVLTGHDPRMAIGRAEMVEGRIDMRFDAAAKITVDEAVAAFGGKGCGLVVLETEERDGAVLIRRALLEL